MLKEFLSNKVIAYEEHDVSRESSAVDEVVRLTGQNGVPVTVVDGQVVVGFDQARLEQLISQAGAQGRPKFGAAVADAVKYTKPEAPALMGAYVGIVRPGSAAEKMGLAAGDIIIQVDTSRISNASEFEQALSSAKANSQLSIIFIRGNTVMSAMGTL
jgi:glutaredoxin